MGEVKSQSGQKGLPSTPQLTPPTPHQNTNLEEKHLREVGPKRNLRLINRFGFWLNPLGLVQVMLKEMDMRWAPTQGWHYEELFSNPELFLNTECHVKHTKTEPDDVLYSKIFLIAFQFSQTCSHNSRTTGQHFKAIKSNLPSSCSYNHVTVLEFHHLLDSLIYITFNFSRKKKKFKCNKASMERELKKKKKTLPYNPTPFTPIG